MAKKKKKPIKESATKKKSEEKPSLSFSSALDRIIKARKKKL